MKTTIRSEQSRARNPKSDIGFTLVELLVVNARHSASRGTAFILGVLLLLTSLCQGADSLDTWTVRNTLPMGEHLRSIAYGNGVFVAVGGKTTVTSTNGTTWTQRDPGTQTSLSAIAYGNGLFVAVGG